MSIRDGAGLPAFIDVPVTAVPCPQCGAAPGDPCRMIHYNRRVRLLRTAHGARIRDAALVRQAARMLIE